MTAVDRRTLLHAGLAGAAGLLVACGKPEERREPPPQPSGTTRLRYGYDYQQYLDLRRPRGEVHGTVVLFHGGYWQYPHGADLMENLAMTFGRLGYATANVEYRRVGSGGGFPTTFEDVAAAVDRLADEEVGDLVAVGHSAGGHLAAWAASRNERTPGGPPDRSLRTAISLSGVLDLTEAAGTAGPSGPTIELMGGAPEEVPERYQLGDPARLIPTCPVFACHATGDMVVPVEQSQGYVDAVRAADGQASYVSLPGDHLSIIDPLSDAFPTIKGLVAQAVRPTPIASGP